MSIVQTNRYVHLYDLWYTIESVWQSFEIPQEILFVYVVKSHQNHSVHLATTIPPCQKREVVALESYTKR